MVTQIRRSLRNLSEEVVNKLEENNYHLWYVLVAYLMYAGYFTFIGLIVSIFEKSLTSLLIGFLIGSLIGCIVAISQYFAGPPSQLN